MQVTVQLQPQLVNEIRKGLDPNFDYTKLAFVQEASGKQTEDLLISAQSSVNDARKNSIRAAYNLFTTSLDNDHVVHDKHVAASAMNVHRARSVLVHSLEVGCANYQVCLGKSGVGLAG